MKKLLSIALISVGLGTFASADTFNLHQGWNLVGSSSAVDVSKNFNSSNIAIVWRYENGQWQYFTTNENIKMQLGNKYTFFTKTSPNEGFWVFANKPVTIGEVATQNNNSVLLNVEKYLTDHNLKLIDYNISNTTILTDEPSAHIVSYIDNNLVMHNYMTSSAYNMQQENYNIHLTYKNKLYCDEENSRCFGIVKKEGNILYLLKTKRNNAIPEIDQVIIFNGNDVNKTINSSSDLLNLLSETPITKATSSDINGTWISLSGSKFINGEYYDVNNQQADNVQIDNNGVIVVTYDNATLYLIPTKITDTYATYISILVDNQDRHFRAANIDIFVNSTAKLTINDFKNILSQEGLSPINYDLSGKTLASEADDEKSSVIYFDNSKVKYFDYKEDDELINKDEFNYSIENGIYKNNKGDYFAVIEKDGNLIKGVGYDGENSDLWEKSFLVLNGDAVDTNITENNIKSFLSDTNFIDIAKEDLEGTWINNNGWNDKYVFNDSNFTILDAEDGSVDAEGPYSINDGIIKVNVENSFYFYFLPLEKSDNTLKFYYVVTKNGSLREGGEITLRKE